MESPLSLKEAVAKGWKLFVVNFMDGDKTYIVHNSFVTSESEATAHEVPEDEILSDNTSIGTFVKGGFATFLSEFAKKRGQEVESFTELLAT
jgi:beta-lactam-binding protein with PASTA domain